MTIALHTQTTSGDAGLFQRLAGLVRANSGPIAALLVRVVAAGLAYVLQIVIARALGVENYGVFAYAWAWVTIGGFACTFGFGQIAVRFLAQYHETEAPALARGFIRTSLAVVGFGALAVSVIGMVGLNNRPDWFGEAYFAPMMLMLATVPLFAIGDLAEGYARSHGWSLLALVPPYILRQGLILLGVPLVHVFGITPDATVAMTVALFATLGAAVLQLHMTLARLHDTLPESGPSAYAPRAWFAAAWPVFLGDVAMVLRQTIDLLILAMYVEPQQLALYFAATRIATMLGLVEFAVGAAAAHRFARIGSGTGQRDALRALARQTAALTFWPTLFGAVLVTVLSPAILWMFGEVYMEAAPLVALMAIGFALRAAIGPAEEFLIMCGHSRSAMLAQFIGLETTVILCWRLVPEMGPAGAALGTLGAMAVTTAILAFCCGRLTGIVPLPLPTSSKSA